MQISKRLHVSERNVLDEPSMGEERHWYRFIGEHWYEFNYARHVYPNSGSVYHVLDVWKSPGDSCLGYFRVGHDRIHTFRRMESK